MRSHVLQRDALQRSEPDGGENNVLRVVSPRQALETAARCCRRDCVRRANCPPCATSERRGNRGNQKLDRERESIAVPNRSQSGRRAVAIVVSIRNEIASSRRHFYFHHRRPRHARAWPDRTSAAEISAGFFEQRHET